MNDLALSLARDLIRRPSVTPVDAGALDVVEAALKAAGFGTHRLVFSDVDTPDVDNLFAKIGTGAPHLVFAGHTDVVPTGDVARWRHPPFAADIVDDRLYGRGASDMKGAIAAFMAAAIDYIRTNGPLAGSLSFLITGDEEGPSINGTAKMLDWARARGEKFDHCILGEPTNPNNLGDMIKIGRRGSLTGHIIVEGKQGHIAYPHLAENPIRGIVKLMAGVMAEPLDAGTDHFSASNLEFATVDVGNKATNVIPQSARASFNVRFNDRWTHATLAAEIEERLRKAAGNDVRYRIEFEPSNADAFVTTPGPFVDMAVEAIKDATGITPQLSTTGGTSDARFIKDYCPVIEFGLVGQTMHQIDERVPVADIDRLAVIFQKLMDRYFRTFAA